MYTPLRIGVLGSGKGSNFEAIAEAIESGRLNARICLVLSDNAEAGILSKALSMGVPAEALPVSKFQTKLEPEIESLAAQKLLAAGVELVVLAGYMRMIKTPLLESFKRRIVNIHPSLLPSFPGLEAWRQAVDAGSRESGCTVHWVDSGMDTGEIIEQARVRVLETDTPQSLHERIQAEEHRLYPEVLMRLAADFFRERDAKARTS